MSVPWYGEIMVFGGNFAPVNWALCNGATLSISQNETLFQLLGTTFGGDGMTVFNLPNLTARFPLGPGNGPGLSQRQIAETGGASSVTLFANALPVHTHALNASTGEQTSNRPGGGVPARGGAYGTPDGTLAETGAVAASGATEPHDNMPPYLALTFCVALTGIFPSQS
jgi:microcystin-dependent protein